MDYDLLIGNLYESIISNKIKQEPFILNFSNGVELNSNNIISKKVKIKLVIVKIPISNNIVLLVEDEPINFFLSLTIIIGDKCNIKSFKFKENTGIVYVADKKLMDKLIDKIELNSISDISLRRVKSFKCHLDYDLPKIVLELKEYIKKTKKLDLDYVHIVHGENICNFVPLINDEHLYLAKKMDIYLSNLIEKNYIKDSNINIYDETSLIDKLKPIFDYEKEKIVLFDKKNKTRVQKVFSNEIFFYPDIEEVVEKLNLIEITSEDKQYLINEIQKIKKIRLSYSLGSFMLPIWTYENGKNFILFNSKKKFLEISGFDIANFKKDDFLSFNELYLQSEDGYKGVFCNKYLNKNYEDVFNENINSQVLFYRNLNELILKLSFSKNKTNILIKEELISKTKIIQLNKVIRKLLEFTITSSVNYNKLPYETILKNTYGKYYKSLSSAFFENLKKYAEFPSKLILIDETLDLTVILLKSFKFNKPTLDSLYDINNSILALIEILAIYDSLKSKQFLDLFNDYFEKQKPKNYLQRNKDIEKFIKDIIFVNSLAKKYEIFVIIKEDFDRNLFIDKVNIANETFPIKSYVLRPNVLVLKNIFPYSYFEACFQIKNISYTAINYSTLKLKNNIFPIKKEYYTVYPIYYDTYKEIFSNKYFSVIKK